MDKAQISVAGYGANGLSVNGEVPQFPIGTIDELEAMGLDVASYPSCSRPNRMAGVKGCDHFSICPFSYKGKSFAEGGGPHRHAWEYAKGPKLDNKIVRVEGECYSLAGRIQDIEENKGAVNIIANENETYEKLEGVACKSVKDVNGKVKKVVADATELNMPGVKRDDLLVTHTVKPFPRPDENQSIAQDMFAAKIYQREMERKRDESFGKALAIPGAATPVDKRNKRVNGGS